MSPRGSTILPGIQHTRFWRRAVSVIVVSLLASSSVARAASIPIPVSYTTNVSAGFLPQPSHPTIGYVYALQFGTTALSPDLNVFVSPPTNPPKTINVVASMSDVSWAGGNADPVHIDAYVSQANYAEVAGYLKQKSPSATLRFSFAVLGYDVLSGQYEPMFSIASGATITTSAVLSGGIPEVSTSPVPVPVTDGTDVKVYKLSFYAAAPPTLQTLIYRPSFLIGGLARPWGT
jgi:hypothetical protein